MVLEFSKEEDEVADDDTDGREDEEASACKVDEVDVSVEVELMVECSLVFDVKNEVIFTSPF